MTGPDSDNELEAFLARRSLMHRRFAEGDQSEPPAEVDRIVLAKAREAIKRPSETPVYRAPQWAMPVGLAASVLLVFAVVLNFVHVSSQQPQLAASGTAAPQVSGISDVRELPAERAASAPATPALADAKTEAAYAPSPPAAAGNEAMMKRSKVAGADRQANQASPAVARNDNKRSQSVAGAPATAGPSAPTAEARKDAEVDSRAALAKRDDAEANRGFLAGANVVSGVSGERSSDAPPLAASTTTGVIPESAQGAMATSDAAPLASTQEVKPAPVNETARSEASKDESKQNYTASTNAGTGSTLEETTVTRSRTVRGGKRPAVPNPPAAIAMEKAKHPNPDEWLRQIGELRTAGRADEANRQLEMFRRAYPDHSIPSSAAEPQSPAQ
jgi:hypothetical protein